MQEPFVYLTSAKDIATDDLTRVFAIGKFDGLHIAHHAVLKEAVAKAHATNSTPCIFTFSPHPRFVLTGDPAYDNMLTPPYERAEVARSAGIEEIFVANFNKEFRAQSAEEFIRNYLIPLGAKHLVVGYNFHFGKNGATDAEGLKVIAGEFGLTVDVIGSVNDHGKPVSSSRIRMYLECGAALSASELLGRPYRVRGVVVRGDARGRSIGFPTANLKVTESYVLPKVGVYVVDVTVSGNVYRGMMNLGFRPTVDNAGHLSLEVNLLDFEGDLYGRELVVDLLHFIRDEKKFDSLSELQEQLRKDRDFARIWPNI